MGIQTTFPSPTPVGAKVITVETTVTNTSGSYSNTITDERMTTALRAIDIQMEHPEIFGAPISVTPNNGSVTISCSSIAGTSDVEIALLKVVNESSLSTSTEFDVLDNRKANKVSNATNGNFAALDSNGNLTDSGHKHSDYITTTGSDQIIDSGTASTALSLHSSTSGAEAKIYSNSEGGNLRLTKTTGAYIEFDSNNLAADGTGFARMYVPDGNNNLKTFGFRQNGDFFDGVGNSTVTLSTNLAKLNNATYVSKAGETAIKDYLYDLMMNSMSSGESRLVALLNSDSTFTLMDLNQTYTGYLFCQYKNGTTNNNLTWIGYDALGNDIIFSYCNNAWRTTISTTKGKVDTNIANVYARKDGTSTTHYAQLKADGEGGNLRLVKDGKWLEIDGNSLNGSTGFARLYLGKTGTEFTKGFYFWESGEFSDGNSNILGNKAEKKYSAFYGTVAGRGAISDALHVDTTGAEKDANRVGYVYSGLTIQLPSDCSHGIREVFFYNTTSIFVKITGSDLNGAYAEWGNHYTGNGWYGWHKIDNTVYNPGETVSYGGLIMPGHITGSTKTINLNVILPKICADRTITITQLVGAIRGPSGYVDETTNSTDLLANTNYTITVVNKQDNHFVIKIVKSEAFTNIGNNQVVSAWVNLGLLFS